jgi:hypothetical protein
MLPFFLEIDSRSIGSIFDVEGGVDNNSSSYHRRGEAFIIRCCDLSNNCFVEHSLIITMPFIVVHSCKR